MMRILWIGAMIALGLIVGCRPSPLPVLPEEPPAVPAEDLKAFAEANSAFAIDLFKALAEKPGNVVVSPYSISSALAMTYAGARGQTADEMKKVLHFTLPPDKLHPAFGGVSDSFQTAGKNRPYELNIANALWSQRGLKLEQEFLAITGKSYGAGVREVDFGQSEVARGTINKWVEEQTKEKIKELLKQGDIDPDVRLVLTNAVHFQGQWKQKFDEKQTRDGAFEIAPGKKVQVPMMSQEDMKVRMGGTADFRLLELPYEGDRWRMIFLLPSKRNGLREVEAMLTAAQLSEAVANLEPRKQSVVLPRFKFRLPCKLKDQLTKLGMPTAFSKSAADFTGMTQQMRLFIGNVIHEACIEVDEKGTVAAAATGVEPKLVSPVRPFELDQPFLFLLRDNLSDTILFLGRVSDPR